MSDMVQGAAGDPKDQRRAECPYCGGALKKIPSKKTKCPHCGKFMFVRTRPKDRVRVVVTKEEAERIEEEWSVVAMMDDPVTGGREEFEKEVERLRARFPGRNPAMNDIKWGLLNKQLMEHGRNGDWGLYRNTRFAMGELLGRELKLDQALRTYLEVCYLDLNGTRNVGGLRGSVLLREFPPFDAREAFLAPGVLERIQRLAKKLELGRAELEQLFIEHNSRVGQSMKLPRTAEQCWPVLQKELET